ncbi:hypothetical protein [Psychromicrobium sp. YIM B11713]|uniref:hypothetical protein n=1 Tax=Psychromicrobium sp. YIM B11713 TaxID=3145233 RepID=UPI00374E5D4A
MIQDILALRDVNGLFRMPESDQPPAGDLYATALYAGVDSSKKIVTDINPLAVDQKLKTTDLSEAPSFWSTVMLEKSVPKLSKKPIVAAAAKLRMPAIQNNTGAEVAAIWTFASSVKTLKELSIQVDVTEVSKRLASINLMGIKPYPYLLWRVWDSYQSLDIKQPEELTALLKASSILTLPSSPESVFDVQAVAEASRVFGEKPVLPEGIIEHLKSLLFDGKVNEDIVRVSILRTLILLDHDADAQNYLRENVFSGRIEFGSGLVQPIIQRPGIVEATYLASRLLDKEFPRVVSSETANSLITAITSNESDSLTKLKAVVALKREGDSRWKDHINVVDAVKRDLPKVVTLDQLAEYLARVDALVQVDDKVDFAKLKNFDAPLSDKSLTMLAFMALKNFSYFSNSSEIGSWFPNQQKMLKSLVSKPTEPVSLYVAGLSAMTSASASGLRSPDFTDAVSKLRDLRGCEKYKSLYRSGINKVSPCSLTLSVQLMSVPNAYQFEGSK